MDVTVSNTSENGRTVVDVTGEVDVYTAPALRERLIALVESGRTDLVVDLTQVRFMDSTGLGLLVGVLKRIRGLGGQLQLVIDAERLLKVFRITSLDQVFTIRASRDEAMAARGNAAD
ncbi:STAS domain-containing protein [Cellulomonas taurus]|uniref:STAS domain-containing protein n=1 Tax=Cellulomonas taurus TaxID=2729175 RepID=UPI00145EAD82|nr:STAS domain-containing protein [Cellulomonas taurus]